MNKRLPLLLSLLALILLAASIAYWVLQLYKPEQRPLAAAPVASQPAPSPEAAAGLFGGQPTAVIANFQLTGVVAAGADSAVILVADGQPPRAVRIGREIVPNVTVVEVHRRYVMLSDGGVMKRVDLAPDAGQSTAIMPPEPRMMQQSMQQSTQQPMQQPMGAAPGAGPQSAPGVVGVPPAMQSRPPPGGGPQGMPTTIENSQVVPEPEMDPIDPNAPPSEPFNQAPANQVQMPPNIPAENPNQPPITQ